MLTDLGGAQASWLLLPVLVAWLLVRRVPRLAVWVAVSGLGAAVLDPAVKAVVGRVRPVVEAPVAAAPGASFPSGHALGSTVTYGVLLLVFLPVVPDRHRRTVMAGVVALVAFVGVTRVALGVHYPSDVVGGWSLGVLWLAVTVTAFRRRGAPYSQAHVEAGGPPSESGLAPRVRPALEPAPARTRPLPEGWRDTARLLVAGVLLWGLLLGAGVLIADVFPVVQRAEAGVLEWLARNRSPGLTTVAVAVGRLGGTLGIVVAVAVAAPLALAATRRWAPPVFLLVAVVGETALFLATATVIERTRPPMVRLLTPELPPTSSFPSGHVAAATATYGAVAVLVWAWAPRGSDGPGWLRWTGFAVAVPVIVGVALSRLYRGVHFPTDVVVSVLYATLWLAVCWRVIRPARGSPAQIGTGHRADGQRGGSGVTWRSGTRRRSRKMRSAR